MQVGKWGNSLAVRIPKAVAQSLALEEGDEVVIDVIGSRKFALTKVDRRQRALAKTAELAKALPNGWRFDRDEASAR